MTTPVSRRVRRTVWSATATDCGGRELPEECPVALVHDASTTAVMMATPADLEDFACGFSLTEGIVDRLSAIDSVEIVEGELGFEARVWLKAAARATLSARRRRIAGPTGCGLCGLDSLAEASKPPPRVTDRQRYTLHDVRAALADLAPAQKLGAATRGVHAAAWWRPDCGLVALREDVGRHNALDKLAGALLREQLLGDGVLVLTSRVSVEMAQKAAAIGAEALVAISVPTALAVRTADEAGMTLIAVARCDSFEVFTHPHRLVA